MKRFWLGILFLAWSADAAVDIIGVGFEPQFHYKELGYSCDFSPFAEVFFLTAEMEDDRITRAIFRKNYYSTPSQKVELTPEEIAGLTLHRDKLSRVWIKDFQVSPRILMMLFYGGYQSAFGACTPTSEPVEFSPADFTYRFETAPLEGEAITYGALRSNNATFGGKTKEGRVFRIDLTLRQTQL